MRLFGSYKFHLLTPDAGRISVATAAAALPLEVLHPEAGGSLSIKVFFAILKKNLVDTLVYY